MFNVRIESRFNHIPGYEDTSEGDISRFIKRTLLSELVFDLSLGPNSVEEYSFFTRSVLFGFFRQNINLDSSERITGYNYFVGLGNSFDLFKKKAVAYYDKGQYHYDFTGREEATQPTEFTDKFAIINLFGPVFDLSLYSSRVNLRFSMGVYADFALVNSLALNQYSLVQDIYEPRMKTTLSHYGYYYAFGYTLSSSLGIYFRNIEIEGNLKYQYYDSIEGLDRFQDEVVDDCNVTDSRLMGRLIFGYNFPKTPVNLIVACEGIGRKGTLHDITKKRTEIRIYTQVKLSF
jgi:hypothetical protein